MYTVTVGLEIHAELRTATKMFCACRNNPDERVANLNVCPVCLAHPGALPTINKEAVRKVLMVGKAVGGTLADYTEFDRKNYFYPDIPKGYQISQYQFPLVQGGELAGVALTRIHLEEDTARSQHEADKSLVDYNRAGVPLMELVTEPVITSAETAGTFARELQLLLRALGAGEANMEKGEMRVEANISVSKDSVLGTKVEVKNLNSFRSVERAIAYEVDRQSRLLQEGGTVVQETRGWDEGGQKTFSQRKKEQAHDYRYFPDPDLPALALSELPELTDIELPELPAARRARYQALGVKLEDAAMFVSQPEYGALFDEATAGFTAGDTRIALSANYIANDLAGTGAFLAAPHFKKLIELIASGKVSSRGAKELLALSVAEDKDPEVLAGEKGLFQQSDASAMDAIALQVVEEHASVAAEYRAGKAAALQFLLGQGMKLSKGSADPAALKEAFLKALS